MPEEGKALLRDTPDRAQPIPKPPAGKTRGFCTYGSTYSLCGKRATWRVDGKDWCLYHAWRQLVSARGA